MKERSTDVLVIGAGAAGLGAAKAASLQGVSVLVVERLERSGGILNQCIHNGFGLHRYKEELTGPEYAGKLEAELGSNVEILSCRFLMSIEEKERKVVFLSETGIETVHCKALVYTAGARERPFGSLLIPGDRVSGIFTAGVAQRLMNVDNLRPGSKALILGSGDIGLIMARRLMLEGIGVEAVVERMPYPGGLERNVVQCLKDFEIPLHLSTTVAEVKGSGRLQEVTTVTVDDHFNPIRGTEKTFSVDTLVLSVGLVPATTPMMGVVALDSHSRGVIVDSGMGTSKDWIFSAGNCVAIYDLADYVSKEGEIAGKSAAEYVLGEKPKRRIPIRKGSYVGVVSASYYREGADLDLYFRPSRPLVEGQWVLKSRDRDLKVLKTQPLTPSEMHHLSVSRKNLDGVEELTIEVRSHEHN